MVRGWEGTNHRSALTAILSSNPGPQRRHLPCSPGTPPLCLWHTLLSKPHRPRARPRPTQPHGWMHCLRSLGVRASPRAEFPISAH